MNSNFASQSDEERVIGDPWTVLPIKTRKFAKECTEIVLSKRRVNSLINFEFFENLEALWLNNNKLEKIEGLDKNFRLKILCIENNRLTTLEGSLSNMKFLQVLLLNDNKLRNLDQNLTFLKPLSFLKNLNLFGNPLAEEPEYRSRVIYALPSLEDFDRHKITLVEKIKSAQIVREFMDPLSKKAVKYQKKPRVFEKFSSTEKELFREANGITKRNKSQKENHEKKVQEMLEKENFPKSYMPINTTILKNYEKFYDKSLPDCEELDSNDMCRIFNKYDRTNTGIINKSEIQFLFFDIKNTLTKSIDINEKKFIDNMLDFYSKAKETCTIIDVKKCFSKILYDNRSNSINSARVISDLVYIKHIAFEGLTEEKENGDKKRKKENELNGCRNDIFKIKSLGKAGQVILNENKLQSIYK